jgi:uncharacterized membrane protein
MFLKKSIARNILCVVSLVSVSSGTYIRHKRIGTRKREIRMANNWSEHHASVTLNAPIHQVYALFSHFNDFPKFMSFVKEVTYYDDQRSHWVAEVVGRHEWDAINQDWIENRQIGWRSTNGFENTGRVTFQTVGPMQTLVDVFVSYNPPAGILGDAGDKLGAGSRFENALQHDLDNFARMVDQTPTGALDPTSSNYLFHSGSAAAKGTTTSRQDATMGDEKDIRQSFTTTESYPQTVGSSQDRPVLDEDIINEPANVGSKKYNPDVMGDPDASSARPVIPPDRDLGSTRE